MKITINELKNLLKRIIKEEIEDESYKEQRIEELKAKIKELSKALSDAPNNEKQKYRDELGEIAKELKELREKPKDTTPNYEVEYLYRHEEGQSLGSFEMYVEKPSEVQSEANKELKNRGVDGFSKSIVSIYDIKNNRYVYKNDRTGGAYSKRDSWY